MMLRLCVLVLASSMLAPASMACIRSEGGFTEGYLLTEDPTRKAPNVVVRESEAGKARAMADAACSADRGLFASIRVDVLIDGSMVTLEVPALEALKSDRETLLAVINGLAIPVRAGEPVVVRLLPLRAGGDWRPQVVAIVREGAETEFLRCDGCAE